MSPRPLSLFCSGKIRRRSWRRGCKDWLGPRENRDELVILTSHNVYFLSIRKFSISSLQVLWISSVRVFLMLVNACSVHTCSLDNAPFCVVHGSSTWTVRECSEYQKLLVFADKMYVHICSPTRMATAAGRWPVRLICSSLAPLPVLSETAHLIVL